MLLLLTLVLIVVAGFESSTYVGGITFAIAALAAAPLLIAAIEPARRLRFLAGMAVAAVLVVCLAAPFFNNQLMAVAARGDNDPIVVRHFAVLGAMFPAALRHVLDWPAYWLVLLPIEFPATYVAGESHWSRCCAAARCRRKSSQSRHLACLAGCRTVGVLALGQHARRQQRSRAARRVAGRFGSDRGSGGGIDALAAARRDRRNGDRRACPQPAGYGCDDPSNVDGTPTADGAVFAQTPELWQAVRRYAAPTARVANNPLFLQDLTPWPANISWALLANRSSCFAGRELALALAPLSE